MSDFVLVLTTFFLMLPGFFGVFMPVMPCLPYMFLCAFTLAAFTNFRFLTGNDLLILLGITVLALAIDFFSGSLKDKLTGGTRRAIIYGIAALVAGTLLLPPIGGIATMLIAIALTEFNDWRHNQQQFSASTKHIVSLFSDVAIHFVLTLAFIVLFFYFSL